MKDSLHWQGGIPSLCLNQTLVVLAILAAEQVVLRSHLQCLGLFRLWTRQQLPFLTSIMPLLHHLRRNQ
jgi:hypothetical protein